MVHWDAHACGSSGVWSTPRCGDSVFASGYLRLGMGTAPIAHHQHNHGAPAGPRVGPGRGAAGGRRGVPGGGGEHPPPGRPPTAPPRQPPREPFLPTAIDRSTDRRYGVPTVRGPRHAGAAGGGGSLGRWFGWSLGCCCWGPLRAPRGSLGRCWFTHTGRSLGRGGGSEEGVAARPPLSSPSPLASGRARADSDALLPAVDEALTYSLPLGGALRAMIKPIEWRGWAGRAHPPSLAPCCCVCPCCSTRSRSRARVGCCCGGVPGAGPAPPRTPPPPRPRAGGRGGGVGGGTGPAGRDTPALRKPRSARFIARRSRRAPWASLSLAGGRRLVAG